MNKKTASAIMLTLLLTSMSTLAFHIQLVRAEGTIYIRANGSIDPPTAPISTIDNVTYTITGNINGFIVIERDNMVIDGAGYTVQGSGGGNGIDLSYRKNATIKNFNINEFDRGIDLVHSSNNVIFGNNIIYHWTFWNQANVGGIVLDHSSNNSAFGNNITGNHYSFDLYNSSNNSISENDINNGIIGFLLTESSNNCIYHNNLINNTSGNVYAYNSINIWDDGYPSGGNYWSDYNGSDLFLGENQDQLGSDGVGDTHYVINENNIDHHPLMNPWTSPDAAVLNITTSKRFIGEGYSAYLTAVVENQGGKVENLNTTVYVGQVNVTFQTFLLMSHNSLIHTFSWDSTGFSKGNYTLSIYVEPIEGEEDLADNTMYYDWVFITIPGDVNGDRRVNVLDAILIANSFNSKPGDTNWNPNADVDCDDKVNILDCIVLAGHFNQSALADTLISALTELVDNKVNWTESIATVYLGTMFGKTNMTDLQNAIAASESWQDVLMWSAITIKYGMENETKIKWALNNATMVNGLPDDSDEGYFQVSQRGLLYGYYWADKYSYLQSKWNTVGAFNNFSDAYDYTGHGFLWYMSPTWTFVYMDNPRYLDECAQTLGCFLVFYDVCNVSEALTYAETEWAYINNNMWYAGGVYGDPHFQYKATDEGYECSGGAFLQIIGWLKYCSSDVGNISRLITDMSNRFIIDKWLSPQWCYGTAPYPAIVIHHHDTNQQRRLTSTITAWSSLFSMYLLFNDTEIENFQDMLNGYDAYSQTWKCLYNEAADLYDSSTGMFSTLSGVSPTNLATALATTLQFFMGITPVNASLAVPVESLNYEHLYNMFDSQIFNISLASHKVTVGIGQVGALNFTFSMPVTQMFTSCGIFELTFDSDWGTITDCTRIGSIPERRYLELSGTELNVEWSGFTVWSTDVGKTLGQINASLNLDLISWETIVLEYTNGTQYVFVYEQIFNSDVLVVSTSDTLYTYCNVAGTWRHTYP